MPQGPGSGTSPESGPSALPVMLLGSSGRGPIYDRAAAFLETHLITLEFCCRIFVSRGIAGILQHRFVVSMKKDGLLLDSRAVVFWFQVGTSRRCFSALL